MNWKTLSCLSVASVALVACGQKTEPPSIQGDLLTPAQVATLNADRSLNGQLVAVVGYPLMCNTGRNYRVGDVLDVEIHAASDCKSPQVAAAKVELASEAAAKPGFGATGVRARNKVLAGREFSNETISYLTDDYQVIPAATPVRVSGTVTYPFGTSNTPVLEGVVFGAAPAG